MKRNFLPLVALAATLISAAPAIAQKGAENGQWRYYGGDAGNTKYSPLDQINASNVKNLQIAWRWKSDNFGPRQDNLWEVTPLMVDGVLYATAGARRDVVAIDAANGETLWMFRIDEGERGERAVRPQNRGVAYWADREKPDDRRIFLITPGYQLVGIDAKTGREIPSFGKNGIIDLNEGLDRDVIPPGRIGSSSPAIVIRDTVIVGAALQAGTAPPTKENIPGYIRGYDAKTGKKLWTFKTVPQAGEFGNDTWENDSWKYTGNTGAWGTLSGDEELGYVYIPIEMPTGDFYGGTRLGDNLFSDCLVCLDARTGKRIWHYQTVHHDIWDFDLCAPPILYDVDIDGRKIKAVAEVTKQAFTFVLDRETGKPIWPIEERPVPQSTVPGERTSPTQPFPTKPLPFDRQGITEDDLIDFTPELKSQAKAILAQYKTGPIYLPPTLANTEGKIGTLILPHHTGGSNWPGGCYDPETGIIYVSSLTNPDSLSLTKADPARSNMGYVGVPPRGAATAPARGGAAPPAGGAIGGGASGGEVSSVRPNIGPQGLPLIKPPWGRITAISLKTGDHVWMVPNGDAPDAVKNNPALQGLNLDFSTMGKPERAPLMVTKTLLFSADGAGLFNSGPGGGGKMFRAHDKATGKVIFQDELPSNVSGMPMTYMANGKQYIVVATGARGIPGELIALALP
jgi:quinoprotein glucose dehydrogenase